MSKKHIGTCHVYMSLAFGELLAKLHKGYGELKLNSALPLWDNRRQLVDSQWMEVIV